MRAEPPSSSRRRDRDPGPGPGSRPGAPPRQRCPYLEQILRERALGVLVRYRADCHVDRRTHSFLGRHPSPPCITDPPSCRLYRQAHDEEDARIARYRD